MLNSKIWLNWSLMMSVSTSRILAGYWPEDARGLAWSFRLSVDTLATLNSTTRFRKLKTGVGRPLERTPSHCLPMKKSSLTLTHS